MWSIKILQGAQSETSFLLKDGANTIGRSPQCDITITDAGVSKKHATLYVDNQRIYIVDENSTNGTFVNGLQTRKREVTINDKITLFNTLFIIQPAQMIAQPIPSFDGNNALNMESQFQQTPQESPQPTSESLQVSANGSKLIAYAHNYLNTVVLPGVYKLPEIMEFKSVVGIFILAFIILVTSLSVIPMIEITKSSIQKESQRRTLSLARSLKDRYATAVSQGTDMSFDTRFIEKEDGVTAALVINSASGTIVAPARKAGQSPDLDFVHSARKSDNIEVRQINSSTIGASVPIATFDKSIGSNKVVAHAMVLYDMGSLAIDSGRTLGLYIKVLFIALIFGFILFFLLYKLIEYPIEALNKQVDKALKEKHEHIQFSYNFPSLNKLIANISTALSRAAQGNFDNNIVFAPDRALEAQNLVSSFSSPAIALNTNLNIMGFNLDFENLTGLRNEQLQGENIEALNDQALILSIKDLVDQITAAPGTTPQNNLEFSGTQYILFIQSIHDSQSVAYYLVTAQDQEEAGGFYDS